MAPLPAWLTSAESLRADPVIDRRTFLAGTGTGAVLLAAPLAARAQPVKKPWRIGYLSVGSSPDMAPIVAVFREGLRNRGLIEGENIVVEYRWADGNNEKLPACPALPASRFSPTRPTPARCSSSKR